MVIFEIPDDDWAALVDAKANAPTFAESGMSKDEFCTGWFKRFLAQRIQGEKTRKITEAANAAIAQLKVVADVRKEIKDPRNRQELIEAEGKINKIPAVQAIKEAAKAEMEMANAAALEMENRIKRTK